jgi:uncharacterized protein GlcG (DUF336 family)
MHWDAALKAVRGALEKAEKLEISVCVVIMDRGGNQLAAARDARAPFHSQAIAADKATTAAGFGMPTSQWWGFVEQMNSPGITAGLPNTDRLVMFGGGMPVYDGAELIAGIGVSGGSEEQDEECARAGLDLAGLAVEPG